jgi:hypothetical protein
MPDTIDDLSEFTEVEGGGFHLITSDPFLIAAVRRCRELEDPCLTIPPPPRP